MTEKEAEKLAGREREREGGEDGGRGAVWGGGGGNGGFEWLRAFLSRI